MNGNQTKKILTAEDEGKNKKLHPVVSMQRVRQYTAATPTQQSTHTHQHKHQHSRARTHTNTNTHTAKHARTPTRTLAPEHQCTDGRLGDGDTARHMHTELYLDGGVGHWTRMDGPTDWVGWMGGGEWTDQWTEGRNDEGGGGSLDWVEWGMFNGCVWWGGQWT
jgi:hypothetical protein